MALALILRRAVPHALFVAASLALIYTGAVFYLTPYYIVGGNQRMYDSPVAVRLNSHSYLLSIKSSTSIHSIRAPVAIIAGIQIPISAPGGSCPSEYPFAFDGSCQQLHEARIDFVDFSPMDYEESSSYIGPRERAEHVALVSLSVAHPHPSSAADVSIFMGLWEFADAHRYPNSSTCVRDADCAWTWFTPHEELPTEGPPRCFPKNVTRYMSGCAKSVIVGNYSACGAPEHDPFHLSVKLNKPECRFTQYWSVFLRPPEILLLGGVWIWGNLVWASLMSLWVLAALFIGRKLHLLYTDQYYVKSLPFIPEPGAHYSVKLYVTGEQFSVARGVLHVGNVFDLPIHADFGEENVEGSGVDTLLFRAAFSVPDDPGDPDADPDSDADAKKAHCHVAWDGQFETARFVLPSVSVVLRQRHPFLLKTRLNVLFLPLFYLLHMGMVLLSKIDSRSHRRKAKFRFVSLRDYHVLFIYFVCTHLSLLLSVVFWGVYWAAGFEFEEGGNGDATILACYILYCIVIVVVTVLRLACRTERKAEPDDDVDDVHAMSLDLRRHRDKAPHSSARRSGWFEYMALEDR